MSNTEERTPIRERWTAQAPGPSDEAAAGALLRAAARELPLSERKLAEIHARLRRDERTRSGSAARPAGRLLRPVIVAALLIVFGGALSAAVSHVIRRVPDRPGILPTVEPSATKHPSRRARAQTPQPEVSPSVTPPIASETPPTVLPASPASTPAPVIVRSKEPSAIPLPPSPSIRPSPPSRSLALRDRRSVPQIEPASSSQGSALVTPLMEPAPVAPPPPAPSELARESRLLASAMAKLRQDGDAEAALRLLDQHLTEFATGALRAEATATRIEALLRLGRNPQALALLEAQPLSAAGVGREMLVARAELRADKGRYAAALADFDRLLPVGGKADPVAERALYGRAASRAKAGDWAGARHDFADYLARFPRGRFVDSVRAALAQEHR